MSYQWKLEELNQELSSIEKCPDPDWRLFHHFEIQTPNSHRSISNAISARGHLRQPASIYTKSPLSCLNPGNFIIGNFNWQFRTKLLDCWFVLWWRHSNTKREFCTKMTNFGRNPHAKPHTNFRWTLECIFTQNEDCGFCPWSLTLEAL